MPFFMLIGMTNTVATRAAPDLEGDDDYRGLGWRSCRGACTDDIIAKTALPVDRCLAAITSLEMRGLVDCLLSGEIQRR